MRRQKSLGIVGSIFVGGIIVIASMIFFVGPLFEKDKQSSECAQTKTSHTVVIQNGKATPEHTEAKKCDTLTILNNDNTTRLMAFGQHEKHIVYNGVSEEQLASGQSLTITLDQTGTYLFHDHHEDEVGGDFTVTE